MFLANAERSQIKTVGADSESVRGKSVAGLKAKQNVSAVSQLCGSIAHFKKDIVWHLGKYAYSLSWREIDVKIDATLMSER